MTILVLNNLQQEWCHVDNVLQLWCFKPNIIEVHLTFEEHFFDYLKFENVDYDHHYNKRCACTPSDFIGFWVNSLVIMKMGPIKKQWIH
jgi:hypothetical protein